MKALFKSPELQRKFEEDGFIKLQLLSPAEVSELMAAYDAVADEHEKINIPYITTSHSNNAELIHHVDSILQKVIAPAIDKHMANYNLLFGNYLIKMPGAGSDTSPHQDITFVDESEFASVNIWVALQDISEENGCMYFLRGSHKLRPTLRPTHDYPWAYENVKEPIKERSEQFPAKAGDAFIFNHAVIHGSYANKTSIPRIASVLAAYHSDAPLLHFYLPEGETIRVQKYSMTKDAFLYFIKGSPPAKGVLLGEVNYDFSQLTTGEFKLLLESKKPSKSLSDLLSELFKKWIQ
jgi:hypothetical protein